MTPSRLAKVVTLDNGTLRLAPPYATDTTSVTYARVVAYVREAAGPESSFTKTGAHATPVVVLARYTDKFAAAELATKPTTRHAPIDPSRLVVAVLFYGPPALCCCCVTGGTGLGPSGPSTYETNLWTLDPETGRDLGDTASFPGRLPRLSTTASKG